MSIAYIKCASRGYVKSTLISVETFIIEYANCYDELAKQNWTLSMKVSGEVIKKGIYYKL